MNFKAICTECQDYLQVQRNDEGKVETTCKCGIKKHDNPYNVAAYLIFSSGKFQDLFNYYLHAFYYRKNIIYKKDIFHLGYLLVKKRIKTIILKKFCELN